MSTLVRILAVVIASTAVSALAADGHPHPGTAAPQAAPAQAAKCEHGVQRSLCARCNPKLAPVFKAKGDWCAEHARPESQCVLCHPELAKKGIK